MRSREWMGRVHAEFYDLYVADFALDLAVYRELVAKFPGAVLEAGCATGRVLARLARAGFEVHGIETTRSMLELARQRIRPWRDHARAFDHDLRAAALPAGFHSVLATLYSFNLMIDVEEQRRFLRHARRSLLSPAIIAIDCFCPLALVRPETEGNWREIARDTASGHMVVRDHRQMLTPLLERRTQVFRVGDREPVEVVTHRRYTTPAQMAQLLCEAGFEGGVCVREYDLSSAAPAEPDAKPAGPFLMIAEC